MMKNKKGEF